MWANGSNDSIFLLHLPIHLHVVVETPVSIETTGSVSRDMSKTLAKGRHVGDALIRRRLSKQGTINSLIPSPPPQLSGMLENPEHSGMEWNGTEWNGTGSN